MNGGNTPELPCARCGMLTTHERFGVGFSCIRCRVFAEQARYAASMPTRNVMPPKPGMPIVRLALNVAAILFLGTVATCGYTCYACGSAISEADHQTAKRSAIEQPPETAPTPPEPPNTASPTLVSSTEAASEKRYAGKKLERIIKLEKDAAQAVIDWCGNNGTAPLWRGALRAEATYVDDRKANRVNVTIDHPRKGELLQGDTLWYLVTFKRDKPVTIKASKQISGIACRDIDSDIDTELE